MENQLLKLNDQRSAMEKEMGSIVEILESMNGAPGLKEPLVIMKDSQERMSTSLK